MKKKKWNELFQIALEIVPLPIATIKVGRATWYDYLFHIVFH